MKKLVRVAAYARVSADKDAAFHSLEQQVDYYGDYVSVHPDWELVQIYSDACVIIGLTGKTLAATGIAPL